VMRTARATVAVAMMRRIGGLVTQSGRVLVSAGASGGVMG